MFDMTPTCYTESLPDCFSLRDNSGLGCSNLEPDPEYSLTRAHLYARDSDRCCAI